ncbi:MAG: DNA recombination/repair protein RecA, partial [Butyricicoccus sp.]|nr:DNA recombination/repair protein RecA [Butyricicoccus sp.]
KEYFANHPEEAEDLRVKLMEAMKAANEEAKAKMRKMPRPVVTDSEPAAPAAPAKPVSRAVSVDADDFADDLDDDIDG